jgi:peroxidase
MNYYEIPFSHPLTDETNQIEPIVGTLQGTGTCIENPPCKYSKKYRTEDGTCNNELKSLWGSAGYPMERLLPPAYEDGVWAPRLRGHNKALLPSPRVVSLSLCPDVHRAHDKYNLMVMQFGQFVAHDVTQSSSIKLRKFCVY